MTSLTIHQPDLVYDREVPVLCYTFRQDEFFYGDECTARKIANTSVRSSMSTV